MFEVCWKPAESRRDRWSQLIHDQRSEGLRRALAAAIVLTLVLVALTVPCYYFPHAERSPYLMATGAGPLQYGMSYRGFAVSLFFQIILPLVVGICAREMGLKSRTQRMFLGMMVWKIGCDYGFYLVEGDPMLAFQMRGLLPYTAAQYLVFFVLGEWLCRDLLFKRVCWKFGILRWMPSFDRPPLETPECYRRFLSKWAHEHNDRTSHNAAWSDIILKPFIVAAAAAVAWPAYDVGNDWVIYGRIDLYGIYRHYNYWLLLTFTLVGYFSRAVAYNSGELLYAWLASRLPHLALSWWRPIKRFQPTVLRRHGIDAKLVVERGVAVFVVAALLSLSWSLLSPRPVAWTAGPETVNAPVPTALSHEAFERQLLDPQGWPAETSLTVRAPEGPGPDAAYQADPTLEILSPRLSVDISITKEHRGMARIVTEGGDPAYWTTDGSAPDPQAAELHDGQPYDRDQWFQDTALVRVWSVQDGRPSPIRSILATPHYFDVRLDRLPVADRDVPKIVDVRVTGAFCGWERQPEKCTVMEPQPDGSYAARIMIDGTTRVDYKFLLIDEAGTVHWYCDPALPIVGDGAETNNVTYPQLRVAGKAGTVRDGVLEEAFLEWNLYDIGDDRCRAVLRTLQDDVDEVWVAGPDLTEWSKLYATGYTQDGLTYDAYSALLYAAEPEASVAFCFLLRVGDQYWAVGPQRVVPCRELAWNEPIRPAADNLFLWQYTRASHDNRDYRSRTIYFAIWDRFDDGDPANNFGNNAQAFDPTRTEPDFYYGGDLRGLIKRLPYIKQLGAGSLWITPLVDNIDDVDVMIDEKQRRTGYHGYWPRDFFRLDEHAGTNQDLEELHEAMDRLGLRLMLDFAPNHSHPSYQPGWGGLYRDGQQLVESHWLDKSSPPGSQYYHHFGGAEGPEHDRFPERVVKDSAGLADFRLGEPHVDKYLFDAARWWMDRGADSFRIDSLKHIDAGFAAEFADKMTEYARTPAGDEMYIVGEWFGGGLFNAASMDFVNHTPNFEILDFGLHNRLQDVLSDQKSMCDLNRYLERRPVGFCGRDSWQVNFLDNHDTSRLGTTLLRSDRGARLSTETIQRRIDMGIALVMTLPGIPCIYYGTEQYVASTGVDTPNRLMMPGFATDTNIFRIIQRLSELRRESPAVQKGTYCQRWLNDDILLFERRYGDDVVLVAVNRGHRLPIEVQNLTAGNYRQVLDPDAPTIVIEEGGQINLILEPNSILVLRRQ